MKSLVLILIVLSLAVFSGNSQGQKARHASPKSRQISQSELIASITSNFGSKVRVVVDSQPNYLLGDFNGDGEKDIAVLISPEGAQQDLKNAGIKYIEVEPSSPVNGRELRLETAAFKYCYGVAIMHGKKEGPVLRNPDAKYLFYECFIPFRLIPRSTKIQRRYRSDKEPPPKLKGDAIYLYLERDAASIVYWTGKTYRGYYQ